MSELNKAEKYMLENIVELTNNGYKDENPRPKYASDGSPAHTYSINQVVMRFDISKGEFPITELRPIAIMSGIKEILAFYQDQTNDINILKNKYGLNWWDEFEVEDTQSIGFRYGHTIKRYDLTNKLLTGLEKDLFSRRHIVSLWQEQEFEDEPHGLKPCAIMNLWSARKVGDDIYLDMTLMQRSSNFLIAGHINEMQYVALMMMVCKHLGYKCGVFMHVIQNFHVYDRELEQMEELVKRIDQLKQRETQSQPKLILNVPDGTNFYDIKVSDFELVDYYPIKPQLKFDLAI